MPIEVFWGDSEETIVQVHFLGNWTWQEYQGAVLEIVELTAGREYRLDQLLDMRESRSLPSGFATAYIKQGHSVINYKKLGITVIVGANTIMRGLVNSLQISEESRHERLFSDSLENAYLLIYQDRANKASADSEDPS